MRRYAVFAIFSLVLLFQQNTPLLAAQPTIEKVPPPAYADCPREPNEVRQIAYSTPYGRQMGFVADLGFQDGAVLTEDNDAERGFVICNTGLIPWPEKTGLILLAGKGFTNRVGGTRGIVLTRQVGAPALAPGKQGVAWVKLHTPKDPGWYRFSFGVVDFSTGERWGDELWIEFYIGPKRVSDVYP